MSRWVVLASLLVAGCGQGPRRPRFCAKRCAVAADCCPAGAVGCPGEYPQNFACEDGLCATPHCTTDEHCASVSSGVSGLGALGGLVGSKQMQCLSVDHHLGCMGGCTVDSDCGSSGTCAGRAEDGRRYCTYEVLGCSMTRPCLGNLHCVSGSCRCLVDSDCGSSPKLHCIDGACGCGNDVDCGPTLDVCTTDARFRYPTGASVGSRIR